MKINYIFIIIFIIINIINYNNGYEVRLVLYRSSNCTEDVKSDNLVSIFSSTKCSDFGIVNETNSEGTKGRVYYYNDLTSANECKLALSGKPSHRLYKVDDIDVNTCDYRDSTLYYHKYEINHDSTPKVQIGMCNIITIFDNDCDYVKIRSFQNGSCFLESLKEYRQYFCIGDRYFTYSCGNDKTCSNCIPEIIDDHLSNYNQCTGLNVTSNEYEQYLNYYYPKSINQSSSFSSSLSSSSPSSSSSSSTSNNNNNNNNNNKINDNYNNEDDNLNNSIKISPSSLSVLVLFNLIYVLLCSIFMF